MTYQYIADVTLREDVETYVFRDADEQLYQQLIAGNICNIFNSRKMGKSSLAVRTTKRLREEAKYLCVTLDISGDGSELDSRDQWYDGMLDTLTSELDLDIDLYSWLDIHARLSKPKQFRKFIETVIFPQTTQNIVIFLDEIDSILSFKLPTGEKLPTDDFFAFIRSLYNLRASKPEYERLNFCLLGVVTASDLIEDSRRTPFNVGEAIELKGFTYQQAAPVLQRGLEAKFQEKSEQVLRDILSWTDGQPFLTQKLCKLALENADATEPNIAELVQTYVIDNWEAQDNPELLRTIRKRIINNDQFQYNLTSRLLGIYQQILEQGRIAFDNSREHRELQLSGLVVKKNSHLEVYNRIYAQVFNRDWVQQELEKLCCPFREYLNSWIGSNREDTTQLLQGNDLEEGLSWSQRKRLSDEMNDFLTESQIYDRQQLKQAKEKATKIIQLAQKGTQLERKGIQTLRLFNTTIDPLKTLRDAIQAGEDLQQLQAEWRELVQDDPELLKQSPAASPVFTLPEILSHIRQWRQLTGHSSSVTGMAFSPGGEYLATASYDNTAKLWNLQGEELITFTGHSDGVWAVAFSPGGEFLATASGDKTAKLWNLQGEELITFTGHSNWVRAVAFSPGGEFLATASGDKTAKLWNLQGEELITFTGHSDWVRAVAFSPGGEFLATASADKTAKLWNLQGEELITFTGHSDVVIAVAFSPGGEFLATASRDKTVKVWDLQGNLLADFRGYKGNLLQGEPDFIELKSSVYCVCFSPDGKQIVAGYGDGKVRFWRFESLAELIARGKAWLGVEGGN
ncbi:AAA-like domain-containing protein [Planktothrix agardhii]|uniref:AAA-like domain-containing protein n=1 Tax=Planktothrix agardhii TaxID=1160 RepID=UPI001D0BA791|nr:AAA-like domain-containing protein [Planktothrix agardhii]MCB8749556.1 AAA-like domain-containing protein [Planktothrix agardhii 1810]